MTKLLFILFAASLCLAVNAQDSPTPGQAAAKTPDSLSWDLRLSVDCRNGEARVNWSSGKMHRGEFFVIEKSADSLHFETLSALGAASDSAYSVNDNAIGDQPVYYRLRITGSSGDQWCSGVIRTRTETTVSLKFYPNPVDKQLILRATHTLGIQVRDAYGTVWINREIAPGVQVINVSTLQKGTYILQATDRQTNKTVSEQLIKG